MPESGKRVVIYPTDTYFRLAWVNLGPEGPRIVKKSRREFSSDNLVKILLKIKRSLGGLPVRWLLDESKVYLKLIRLPSGVKVDRDLVLEKAQEAIPEFLEENFFDWRLVKADDNYQTIQFLAVGKKYFDLICQSLKKAGIQLETFESVAFGLARFLPDNQPRLVIYRGEKLVLVAAQGSQVLESRALDLGVDIDKKVEEMVEFVKDKWGLELRISDDLSLDPILGLALKKMEIDTIKENLDMSSPDVVIGDGPSAPVEAMVEPEIKTAERAPVGSNNGDGKKKIVLLVVGVLLGLSLVLFLVKAIVGRTEKLNQVGEPTPIPTVAPSPTPTPDRSVVKVKVLNGSGVPGLAGEVKDFLENLGYLGVAVGNANSYDFTDTEIAVKEGDQEYFSLLSTDLAEDYSIASQSSVLEEDSQYDAIITLGTPKDTDEEIPTEAPIEEAPVEE